ncbi:MAG: fumarylacetoacetate hydrolase family protein [Acidobacteriaceae bacterium]|nr:fumarylacetoacetate hydrolase family protein [Acidobacteriaceae bacterium]MBV9678908.1 fumarylacetoacetate hydrolase family protein [Acidobacteriaceae bacterium]MBV9937614.1 fumarylacetoacetate hydrolase family protein [Acidobacteriaceae bacterium]
MKLASFRNGTRDGELTIVSRDLRNAVSAKDIAPCLRVAVESWAEVEADLEKRAQALESDALAEMFSFDPAEFMAPLPRAFQWLDASAYRSHGERMVKAFNVVPQTLRARHPLMYQGCSDRFYGAVEDFPIPSELNIDLEGEVAIITDQIPMAATADAVQDKVLLIMLANDVSLRALIGEMNLGFGMIQCKPSTAFSPVAVTPDELGSAWRNGKLHLPIHISVRGDHLGSPDAGEMECSFFDLMAHAAATRELSAGTILGSGTVSNADSSVGVACISEQRALEKIRSGSPITDFLHFGDTVRIEAFDQAGQSVFGAINHQMVQLVMPSRFSEDH